MAHFLKEVREGVMISLHVIPNAPQSEIVGEHNGALKVKIKSPPVDGKANSEIISFFSRILNISKNQIEILKGDKSKAKTLLVRGFQSQQILPLLTKS